MEFIKMLWLILPAYAANIFPLLLHGKTPMDLGKKFIDGKRILGDGKTIEGFIVGTVAGLFYGSLIWLVSPPYMATARYYGFELPLMTPFIGFLLGLGTMIGDSIGSFIKRRLGMKRGHEALVLDQLPFFLMAFFFASFFVEVTIAMWIMGAIFTLVIHKAANVIAYIIRVKSVPW